MNPNYNSDYEVRLAELGVLGGDTTIKYDSVYSIDLAILERIQGGGIAEQVIDDTTISTSTTYSSSKIVQLLADAGFKTAFVNELPATGDTHTIYFVPSTNPDTQNTKDEFMWTGSAWEQVGSTTVDLSNYYTKPEINGFLMQAERAIENTNTRIDNLIDDSSDSADKTLSSSKILELVGTINNTINNIYENAQTIDFKFGEEYTPAEIGDKVVYKADDVNWVISEYKGEDLGWEQMEWDASALYFDTENSLLYAYNTEAGELIEVTIPNTFIVSDLNTDTKLKNVKTAGTYNVIQHLNSAVHGSYLKNWVMTVTSVDYDDEDYQTGDKWYQVLENNITIKKRSWSATRQTNDGWSTFSNYYKGEVKDTITTPSKYYTYSQFKTKELLDAKQDTLTAGNGISISGDTISTKGYTFDTTNKTFIIEGAGNNVISGTSKNNVILGGSNNQVTENSANHNVTMGRYNVNNGVNAFVGGSYNTSGKFANGSAVFGQHNTVNSISSICSGTYVTMNNTNDTKGRMSAFGSQLTVNNSDETALGAYNISHSVNDYEHSSSNTALSFGIGAVNDNKNAVEMLWDGKIFIKGIGGYQGTDTKVQDATIKSLQDIIADLQARIAALEGNS